MAKIYVVDQNVMRKPQLAELIAKEPTAKFVIPDTGLLEMAKSEQWEETFRLNLALFWPVAARCFMSMSVQEARELEVSRRISAEGSLLPDDFTAMLRGAIVDSRTGDGPTLRMLRARMTEVRNELKDNELNAAPNRDSLLNTIAEMRSKLTKDEVKSTRREGKPGRLARIGLARSIGDAIYVAHMRNLSIPEPVSRRLWKAGSMTRRWCYMLAHHSLQWLGDGGIENASDQVVVNDVLDQDYVLIGSFFDGLLSLETDVRDALEDLGAMLVLPPSVNSPVYKE